MSVKIILVFFVVERGWSGKKIEGRWIGPPDPVLGESFEGFDTKCLMLRTMTIMTGNFGRVRRFISMAVTGNGNGIVGFAMCDGGEAKTVIRQARNRAALHLLSVKVFENRTIYHDFFSKFEHIGIFAHKKQPGYGIVAHPVVKAICECVGIKDIHVKVEGNTKNRLNICKAFILGLYNQKDYQQMADEKQLHVVEFTKETSFYPKVVAR